MSFETDLMQRMKGIERRLARLEQTVVPRKGSTYTITNDTTDRTYDANATSTAELADVLATLIRDIAAWNLPKV